MFWSTHKIIISTGHELHHPHYAHFYCYFSHRLGIKRVKSMLAKTGWNLMVLIFRPKLIISTPFLTFFSRLGWEHLKWKNVKNGVETMSFGRKMSIVKFHPDLANMLLRSFKCSQPNLTLRACWPNWMKFDDTHFSAKTHHFHSIFYIFSF